jgi:hypothetical protein
MIYRFIFSTVMVLALIVPSASAYELGTHARLTQAATNLSILSDAQFMADLGLDPSALAPFGEVYYDVSGNTVRARSVNSFEARFIPLPSTEMLTLSAWLMRGAIREDDYPSGPNPWLTDPDFPSSFFRVSNHFFDPVKRLGLRSRIANGEMAPQWAIGSTDVFNQPNTPNTARQNHFTVFDAREDMYRALTGRDASGNPVAMIQPERNKYWATTFRALGDVVHLVQDMAQPQHTRNDAHSGVPFGGHKSVYEAYIEAMATQETFRTPSGGIVPLRSIVYEGYPIPQLSSFSAYFSTSPNDANILDRKGLADYSNRSFFTAGKNVDSTEYPYPRLFELTVQALDADWLGSTLPLGKATVVLADLPDSLGNPKVLQAPLATESMWDQFLETYNGKKTYTLTKKNYDTMADVLIPRAVAYSAGLINYFFRGKIDFVADPNNAGAYVIKNLGPEDMKGNFTLYYDAVDGARYPVAGDTPTTTWAGLTITSKGQAGNRTFTPPTNPAPKNAGEYMLVFNGDMGQEKATPNSVVGAIAAKKVGGQVLYVANPRDFSMVPGVIDEYSESGQYLKSVPSGLITYQTRLVATDTQNIYTAGIVNTTFSVPSPPPISNLFKNGVPIATLAVADGLAVNTQGVYVLDSNPNNSTLSVTADILHYSFNGTLLGKFSTDGYIGNKIAFCVNERRILMVNVYSSVVGVLYDLTGNQIATVGPFPYEWPFACASATNRHYLAFVGTPAINVYDDNGTLVTTFGDFSNQIYGITASETKIFVSQSRLGKIKVFDRVVTKDSAGNIMSENFQASGSIDAPGFPMGIAINTGGTAK